MFYDIIEMIENISKWFKMIQNDSKWFKMIQNDSKWFKMIQNDSKWFKMIQNDLLKYLLLLKKGQKSVFVADLLSVFSSEWRNSNERNLGDVNFCVFTKRFLFWRHVISYLLAS